MKLSTYAIKICKSYREILHKDGALDREELIKIIKIDEHVPEKFKNDVGLNLMANEILRKSEKEIIEDRRIEYLKQGLTFKEIAEKEGVNVMTIRYWYRSRNIKKDRSTAIETVK